MLIYMDDIRLAQINKFQESANRIIDFARTEFALKEFKDGDQITILSMLLAENLLKMKMKPIQFNEILDNLKTIYETRYIQDFTDQIVFENKSS
jgi:hypothetical protein